MLTLLLYQFATGTLFHRRVYLALAGLGIVLILGSVVYREVKYPTSAAAIGKPPSVILVGGRR